MARVKQPQPRRSNKEDGTGHGTSRIQEFFERKARAISLQQDNAKEIGECSKGADENVATIKYVETATKTALSIRDEDVGTTKNVETMSMTALSIREGGSNVRKRSESKSKTKDKGKAILVSNEGGITVCTRSESKPKPKVKGKTKVKGKVILVSIEGVKKKRKIISTETTLPLMEQPKCKKKAQRMNTSEFDVNNGKKSLSAYPMLNSRGSPTCLYKIINSLNEMQQEAVRSIGFGHILKLQISELPSRLAYWVCDNFDTRGVELKLLNGRMLRVTEDDVHRVFGFPKGKRKIEKLKNNENPELYEEWHNFFDNVEQGKVKPTDMKKVILECEDGGAWFKRHFLILVAHTLMENRANGYVYPFTLNCLEDINAVMEWNWCGYVIQSLIDNKKNWEDDKKQFFVGPTLFMVLLYVDRVAVFNTISERSFPTIANWTYTSLAERQAEEIRAGGFGGGQLCDAISVETNYMEFLANVAVVQDGVQVATNVNDENPRNTSLTDVLLSKVKLFVDTREEIKKILADAPAEERSNTNFQEAMCAAIKELGDYYDEDTDKNFWDKVIECSEEVEAEAAQGSIVGGMLDDIPSFSLGLTQLGMDMGTLSGEEHQSKNAKSSMNLDKATGGSSIAEDFTHSPTDNITTPTCVVVETSGNPKQPMNLDKRVMDHTNMKMYESFGGNKLRLKGKENMEECSMKNVVEIARESVRNTYRPILQPRHDNVLHEPIQMSERQIRSKNQIKASDVLRSPYVQRKVNASKKLAIEEKKLGLFALYYAENTGNEKLFSCGAHQLTRNNMVTLYKGNIVGIPIIDAWAMVLNKKEKIRAPGSPNRFFASTKIYTTAFLEAPRGGTYGASKRTFFQYMTTELENYGHTAIAQIDLFVFPIFDGVKYYEITVDATRGKIFIIDSTNTSEQANRLDLYTESINIMQFVFGEFLHYKSQTNKSQLVRKAKPEVIIIRWGDSNNITDTGVYLMRHMETFMGEASSSWISGLAPKLQRQLNLLRARYCATLLEWDENDMRQHVMMSADAYYKDFVQKQNINIDTILV